MLDYLSKKDIQEVNSKWIFKEPEMKAFAYLNQARAGSEVLIMCVVARQREFSTGVDSF